MPNKSVPLSEAINKYLYEQEDVPDEDADNTSQDSESEASIKDKEDTQAKEIRNVDKNDLDYDDEFEEDDVAISVKLNNNVDKAGEIKLVPFRRLSIMSKIEDLISLFNIKPEEMNKAFEDQLTLTIQSPLKDFEDEKYTIRLMDGLGEISINRDEFDKTISKQGSGVANLGQATDKGLEGESEKEIDLSYLEQLNYEFKRLIKDEFFTRILTKA